MMHLQILFCLMLPISGLVSQETYDFDFEINSSAFNKERKISVHLHKDYYLNEVDSFGVIYVLDGQGTSFYNNAKYIIDYLVWGYQITPMIVVGIHSDNRHKEFIPLDRSLSEDSTKNIGQAHLLRDHIENEIYPLIAKKFRTNKFKAIIGHSRAGSFIANTIFSDKKDLFNAYIAISPGMHYLNNQILDDAKREISSNVGFYKFYYCTHGTVGSLEAYFKPQVNYLDSLFSAYPNKTIEWSKKEMEGKTHWGVVAPSIVDGLLEMNRAYNVDQLLIEQYAKNDSISIAEHVSKHLKTQRAKLKTLFPLSSSRLRYYGSDFSENEDYKHAIELFDLSISIDKNEVNAYLGKASAQRELKDFINAEKVYKEALKVVEENERQESKELVDKMKSRIMNRLENLAEEKHKK